MLFRASAKSWRSTTAKAKVAPDRTSKSYKAGRAIGQLARGQKPTKYSEPATPNPLEGKRNVANISAYKDGRRFDYGYDADTGDLYDIRTEIQGDAATNKLHGIPGGVKVTNMMNLKEYQPVDFGTPSDRPGLIKGRGAKGRKYTGVDAVVKALRDEGGDVFVLDKTPGKGKKASATGGVPHWRSPLTATGEYIDPRKRHEIPTGPGDGYGTGYKGNPAKTAHNMFWRQAAPISEQEKRAAATLENSRASQIIASMRGQVGPQKPPPGAGPAGSPQNPKSGPGGGSWGAGLGGAFSGLWGARSRVGNPPGGSGSTPGPMPSQNQATPPGTAIQPWRRPVVRMAGSPQETMPAGELTYEQKGIQGPEELAGLPGYTEIKGRDWYAQKEGAKTQYGTGPKARKLRPAEAKTAKRNARPAAQAEPVAPEPEIVPGDPLALMPPTQQPPAVKEKKAWRNVGKFQGEVVQPQIQRADVYEAENRLASDFARTDMANLAESGRNNPYVLNENVARDIETAQAGDAFGLNKAFESDDLTTPEGFQVQPETISVLAKTLSDTEQARRGKVLKSPENPFAYSTKSGPETLPFGTEGDMAIQGRLGIAERTIQEIEAERATSPMPGVEYDRAINRAINQVLIDQAAPAKVLMQQREFLAAANEARAKGDAKLAGKIESFADEIAFAAYSRSPKMLDAFSTQREDTGALMRGSYLSSPQQDESRINVLKRPEIEALEAKMAAGEQLTFDEEYAYKRQAEIDATNLKFSAATGQGGKNPADTKMFNTVAMPSQVPWAKNEKDLLSQVPPVLNEGDAADAQFNRELADPSLGNSRFDYAFQPEKFGTSQPQNPADMIAESLAGRLASVSRHGASLGFASNAVDAAGNRQMLQGEQGDEGYAPQGANKHWSSLGTVEKQLEAIQGGGKVPGMSDVHDATYASTFDEYRAKAEDFMASLPPDMPKDQFDAAVTEFMRGEFNRRVQSDYERLKNPEADTTGGHNIFRMPNTKSMIQDDPTKATLQQVFDGAIPEIVTPQSGDPFDAWNQRLQQEQADTNVANAYGMVDQGIYEKARDFWAGQMTGDTALAAERFQGGRDATKYRDLRPPEALPPPMDLEYPQNVLPEAAPAPVRSGLRRSVAKAAPKWGVRDDGRPWKGVEVRNEMNPAEKQIDTRRMASEKQMTRQDQYIFENPGQNAERIEADQLAVGDVVNLHVPTKSGGKLERAEVVHTADGQVALEDGKTFGTILLDQDDPTRDGINVHSIEQHPDPAIQGQRKLAEILGGKSRAISPQLEPQYDVPEIPPELTPESGGMPEIPSIPEMESVSLDKPKSNRKGSKTPGLDPAAFEAMYGTPFQQIVQGNVSKIAIPPKGKQQGEYDGGMDFGSFWNSKIFTKNGGRKPDQVHAELVDSGLMTPDSTVDDMYREIDRGIQNYKDQVGQIKQGKAQAQQAERVEKEVFSPKAAKRNPVAVQGRDLIVGQKLEIAVPNAKGRKDQTEIAEVVDIDEDGMATLEDGDRYGPFTVPEDKILYAKRILEGEPQAAQANPWDAPDAFDMRQTAAPDAFSLKNDAPNMNYDTNQGLLLDVDPNDVERLLIEEQRRKNRQRLSGQSDFFGDVPF